MCDKMDSEGIFSWYPAGAFTAVLVLLAIGMAVVGGCVTKSQRGKLPPPEFQEAK